MLPLSLLLLAPTADATEIGGRRPFGLGIQLGSPSGISGKLYLGGRRNAIDFLLGGPYVDDDDYWWGGVWAHVTYHWHTEPLTRGRGVTIPFRVGVGGFLTTWRYPWWDRPRSDLAIGARVPVGLDFDLERAPVQFWAEMAVAVALVPPTGVGADGGIGVRYYF